MGESTKAATALLMILGGVVSLFAWVHDRPNEVVWSLRLGGLGVSLLMGMILLWLQLRWDWETDYLRPMFGNYFNRDGFCLAVGASKVDSIAYIDVYYQSQYARRCIGQVALRPAYDRSIAGRANFDMVTCRIECSPAAFGVARIPIAIPNELQGKSLTFEIGAAVAYPDGKGERLRFHDGILLRADTNFRNAFGTALTIAAAAAGAIVLSRPAKSTVALPDGVEADAVNGLEPEMRTIWKLGDDPLKPSLPSGHPFDTQSTERALNRSQTPTDEVNPQEGEFCSVCEADVRVDSDGRCTRCGWPT